MKNKKGIVDNDEFIKKYSSDISFIVFAKIISLFPIKLLIHLVIKSVALFYYVIFPYLIVITSVSIYTYLVLLTLGTEPTMNRMLVIMGLSFLASFSLLMLCHMSLKQFYSDKEDFLINTIDFVVNIILTIFIVFFASGSKLGIIKGVDESEITWITQIIIFSFIPIKLSILVINYYKKYSKEFKVTIRNICNFDIVEFILKFPFKTSQFRRESNFMAKEIRANKKEKATIKSKK